MACLYFFVPLSQTTLGFLTYYLSALKPMGQPPWVALEPSLVLNPPPSRWLADLLLERPLHTLYRPPPEEAGVQQRMRRLCHPLGDQHLVQHGMPAAGGHVKPPHLLAVEERP